MGAPFPGKFVLRTLCPATWRRASHACAVPGKTALHGAKHPVFRVDGLDVTCDVTLQPWEAVFGAKKRVPTLDGEVEMNIPAGSSSGRKLRIRGRGLGPASGRGDEYVNIAISVPKPDDLNEEQLKLWKALAGRK